MIQKDKRKKLIVILGPTALGKTKLAIWLAEIKKVLRLLLLEIY